MKPGIRISKIWSDEDLVELEITVSDGTSLFSNQVYAGHSAFSEAVSDLEVFKDHIHGGLFDLRFGEFGSEYANGAFRARFHFPSPGRLFISCKQESDFEDFAKKTVASSANLYLKSEPAPLDRFIQELRSMTGGTSKEAWLEGI